MNPVHVLPARATTLSSSAVQLDFTVLLQLSDLGWRSQQTIFQRCKNYKVFTRLLITNIRLNSLQKNCTLGLYSLFLGLVT